MRLKHLLFMLLLLQILFACQEEVNQKQIELNESKVESVEPTSDTLVKKESKPIHPHSKAIGIWKAEPGAISKWNADSTEITLMAMAWPSIFKYDGEYITGQFFIRNATAIWMSSDDHYKLKTFWKGDSLFYFSTFHKNEFVGCFKDSVFVKQEARDTLSYEWVYRKLKRKELSKTSPILKHRRPFDYGSSKN